MFALEPTALRFSHSQSSAKTPRDVAFARSVALGGKSHVTQSRSAVGPGVRNVFGGSR